LHTFHRATAGRYAIIVSLSVRPSVTSRSSIKKTAKL